MMDKDEVIKFAEILSMSAADLIQSLSLRDLLLKKIQEGNDVDITMANKMIAEYRIQLEKDISDFRQRLIMLSHSDKG